MSAILNWTVARHLPDLRHDIEFGVAAAAAAPHLDLTTSPATFGLPRSLLKACSDGDVVFGGYRDFLKDRAMDHADLGFARWMQMVAEGRHLTVA